VLLFLFYIVAAMLYLLVPLLTYEASNNSESFVFHDDYRPICSDRVWFVQKHVETGFIAQLFSTLAMCLELFFYLYVFLIFDVEEIAKISLSFLIKEQLS
jgi:hypothetical protein